MVDETNQYVKLTGSGAVHTALKTLSATCDTAVADTKSLELISKQKYALYSEARKATKGLLFDLKEFKKLIAQPGLDLNHSNTHLVHLKEKIVDTKVPPSKPLPKKKIVAHKSKTKQKATKSRGRPKAKVNKRVTAKPNKPQSDGENLKRLKANLDAIRSSLK